ncbi:MAG: carbohydrate porin [Nitrospirota bacterium]
MTRFVAKTAFAIAFLLAIIPSAVFAQDGGLSTAPASNPAAPAAVPASTPAAPATDPAAVSAPAPVSGLEKLESGLPSWFPKVLGLQFNGIYQYVPDFHSPYAGAQSFLADHKIGDDFTHVYGVYLGSQVTSSLQAYLDFEMERGAGVSKGQGLAGYINGDAIRAASAKLGDGPYVARAYLRYFHALSAGNEKIERAQDQLPGNEPVSRIDIKAGLLASTDDFDLNRYANNNRTQFFNYSFLYNPAWDFAADTRGYTYGIAAALVKPAYRLAYGCYMVPKAANGSVFDDNVIRAQGNNLELTLKPNAKGTVVRILGYLNQARMGNYAEAIEKGRITSTTPDIKANEKPGRTKYGFGINVEQPLADDGETGIFGRAGWNDGHNESFMYTEVDRHLSLGAQVCGIHWSRADDRMGVAYGVNGLSPQHKDYLAAGGLGMLIGDGKLNYGLEQITEAYYRIQAGPYLQFTPDFQFIQNPGYNKDRGPVFVYSLRARLSI